MDEEFRKKGITEGFIKFLMVSVMFCEFCDSVVVWAKVIDDVVHTGDDFIKDGVLVAGVPLVIFEVEGDIVFGAFFIDGVVLWYFGVFID